MSIIVTRLTLKFFVKDYECPPHEEHSYRIYALVCDKKNTTFEDIKSLSGNDRNFARTAFIKLLKNAATGQPFQKIFDGGQYHVGHEFNYHNAPEKIWRLWLAGEIRIYFIYLPDHTIVILKTLAKRKNDLSQSEKSSLEKIAKKIIDCYKDNLMEFSEDK